MLRLGVPSKGRLQDETIAWFAARGIRIARAGQGREYRGTVEGIDGVELVLLSAGEIPGALASGGLELGVTGQDLVRERDPALGGAARGAGADGLRLRRPRRRGAGLLDRRRRDGRPRRRRRAVPRPPRPPPAGRDQVPPSGPGVLPAPRRRQLPARRQPGRDRGRGQERHRRGGRRHHHHRRDAARQPPAGARRRADPAQPGDALPRPRRRARRGGRRDAGAAPRARSALGAPAV